MGRASVRLSNSVGCGFTVNGSMRTGSHLSLFKRFALPFSKVFFFFFKCEVCNFNLKH